jgi:Ca2+-binding EF-hand superfamily protein
LTNKSAPVAINKNPTFKIHKIQNNSIAVDFAKSEKISVVGCGAEDFVDGRLKIILGFVWTLILKYQINKGDTVKKPAPVKRKPIQKGDTKVEIELVEEQIQELKKVFVSLSTKVADVAVLLDLKSVQSAFQAIGIDITEEEIKYIIDLITEENIHLGIEKNIDVTKGGIVDFEVLTQLVKRKIEINEKKKAYASVETSNSGKIDLEKVLTTLKELGFTTISIEEIEQQLAYIISSTDSVSSHKAITTDEFIKLVSAKLQNKSGVPVAQPKVEEKKPAAKNPKAELLQWMSEMMQSIDSNFTITDFTTSWTDGKLLASLVRSLAPKSVKSQINLDEPDPLKLTQTAIKIAEEELGIPMIIEPVDVVNNPEELSMMTYISYFRDYMLERGDELIEEELPDASQCSIELLPCSFFSEDVVKFIITSRGEDGQIREGMVDEFEISISGPIELEPDAVPNGNGTYTVEFKPPAAGEYKLFAAINGSVIKDSPVKFLIKDPVSPQHCQIVGIDQTIATGYAAEFTIKSMNKYSTPCDFGGYKFDVEIIGPEQPVEPTIVDNMDGTYTVTWTPEEAGSFYIAVGANGIDIDKSPYFVLVRRQVIPGNCIAEGIALNNIIRPNEETTITIQTKDETGNNILTGSEDVQVEIQTVSEEIIHPVVQDNGNGTYVTTFALKEPGAHTLSITVNGEPIAGSPFTITAEPELYAPNTEVALISVKTKPDGCTIHFTVCPLDKFGNAAKTPSNIVASVFDENNEAVETKLIDFNRANFSAFFKPKPNQYRYKLSLSVNNAPLKNSPLELTLKPTIDPSLCIVEGPGLEGGDLISRLGFPAIFTITAKDIDGNDMPEEPNDTEDIPINLRIIDRFYAFQDAPVVPPTMEKKKSRRNAMKKDEEIVISGSNNPMYYNVRYYGAVSEILEEECEVENPLWVSPDSEPEIETLNNLYEVVDISRLERLRKSSPFVVRIVADDYDEEEITPFILKSGTNEYTVMYTTPYAGTHTISIQHDEQDVAGSPFQATFTKGIDPRRCNMTGPGTKKAYVNIRTCFDIYAFDQNGRQKKVGGDDFEVVIKDPTGTSIKEPVIVEDHGDGTYKCYYTPQLEGPHTVKVKCMGIELPNSSVKVHALSQFRMPDIKKVQLASSTPIIRAKTPSYVNVTLADMTAGGDSVEAQFITPFEGYVLKSVTKDNGNGTYSIFYEPPLPGIYKCKVTVNGEPVEKVLELPVVAALNPTVSTIGSWTAEINTIASVDSADFTVIYKGNCNLEALQGSKTHFKLVYDAPTNDEEINEKHIIDIMLNNNPITGAPFWQTFE